MYIHIPKPNRVSARVSLDSDCNDEYVYQPKTRPGPSFSAIYASSPNKDWKIMATHGKPCFVTLRNIFGALPLAASPSVRRLR